MNIKPYIKYITLLILLMYGCDKYEISDDQQLSFIKYYGLSAENEGIDVQKTNDGYLIFGNSNTTGNNNNIIVLATDHHGNLTREIKIIETPNNDYVNKVIPVEDDHFLIIASTQLNANNTDLYLIKINSQGTILWESRYGNEFNNEGYDAAMHNDQYVVIGYVSDASGATHSWNARWSSDGNLINQRATNSNEDQQLVGITVHNDQPYVVGQIMKGNPASYDIFHASLSETGRLFGIIDYSTMQDGNQDFDERAVDILVDNDHRIILGYYENENQVIPLIVGYAHTDNTVQKNWESFIREANIQQVNDISKKEDELLVLVNTVAPAQEQGVKIYKTNINADNYKAYDYGENNIQLRGNKISHFTDGVGMLGTSELGDNSSIIFIKLRPDLSLQ